MSQLRSCDDCARTFEVVSRSRRRRCDDCRKARRAEAARKHKDLRRERPPEPCSFSGCDRPKAWGGYCRQHLKQRSQGKEMSPLGPWVRRGGACSADGCGEQTWARGWCKWHYMRWRKGIPFDQPKRPLIAPLCTVEGCERRSNGYLVGIPYCPGHLARMRSSGEAGDLLPLSRPCDYCATTYSRRGRGLYCSKDCSRAASRARHYGLTPAELRRLELDHRDCCGICGRKEQGVRESGTPIRLAVDHDHDTGAVRGLLCRACNTAIGAMQDDPDLLLAAAAYVERYRTTQQRRTA